jgi:uncharacterized phage protein (TIGR02218 family)
MRQVRNISGGYNPDGSDLLAHIWSASPTVAICVSVQPTPGAVVAFTSYSSDLTLPAHPGVTYKNASGLAASKLQTPVGSQPSVIEVTSVLTAGGLLEAELNTPKWQGATVDAFLVNYVAPQMGELVLPVSGGRLGAMRIQAPLIVTAEAKGINNALVQNIGRVTAPLCDADFGDARCTLNLVALGFVKTGVAVAAVTDPVTFRVAAGYGVDYFTNGKCDVETGNNAGFPSFEVKSYDNSTGVVVLQRSLPYTLTTGDTVKLTRGCKKDPASCTGYGNILNHRGMPFVPLEAAFRVVEG